MDSAQDLAAQMSIDTHVLFGGSLCFFGEWFGRPMDNLHKIVHAKSSENVLIIEFDEDEVLTITSPRRADISKLAFIIGDADAVKWEWYSYGRPKTDKNLCFREFEKSSSMIEVRTNESRVVRTISPKSGTPAVEMR